MTPPPLSELLLDYLSCTPDFPERPGEVELFSVSAAFRIDGPTAWRDATALLPARPALPGCWDGWLRDLAPRREVPAAIGAVPQRVAEPAALFQPDDGPELPGGRCDDMLRLCRRELEKAVTRADVTAVLLYAGLLRESGALSEAGTALAALPASLPAEWATRADNERGALAWAEGDRDRALSLWSRHPTDWACAFNRRLADPAATGPAPPAGTGWAALAELYAAVAASRAA